MTQWLRLLLLPLNPVYAGVIFFRNMFFEKGILPQTKADVPVVSVGNLNVGGSGKTPLVIKVGMMLRNAGYNPGVLSRGYGRESRGYVLVSKDGELKSKVEECGDEIYQTVLESGLSAAVSEDRVSGAQNLVNETRVNLIILDDGFQHRYIAREVNIAIFDTQLWLENCLQRILLPAGNLREPVSALKRADIIIANSKFSENADFPGAVKQRLPGIPVFKASYAATGFTDIKTGTRYSVEDFRGQKSLVLSGIANPQSFFEALQQNGINTENKMILKDHAKYSEEDIQQIRKLFYSTNVHSVITTQKDKVKLVRYAKELDDIDIYTLNIELRIEQEEEFLKLLKQKIQP